MRDYSDYARRVIRLKTGEPRGVSLKSVRVIAIRTQAEVAKIMGCRPQNVQQLERKALWKLRRALASYFRELKESGSDTPLSV